MIFVENASVIVRWAWWMMLVKFIVSKMTRLFPSAFKKKIVGLLIGAYCEYGEDLKVCCVCVFFIRFEAKSTELRQPQISSIRFIIPIIIVITIRWKQASLLPNYRQSDTVKWPNSNVCVRWSWQRPWDAGYRPLAVPIRIVLLHLDTW